MNPALRDLVSTGPLCHLSTVNPDGSPQVTVVWVGADGDELVTAHLPHNQKVRNMERDPRVMLSFLGPHEEGALLQPYAVVRARATVARSDEAWDVLDRPRQDLRRSGRHLPGSPQSGVRGAVRHREGRWHRPLGLLRRVVCLRTRYSARAEAHDSYAGQLQIASSPPGMQTTSCFSGGGPMMFHASYFGTGAAGPSTALGELDRESTAVSRSRTR